VSPVQPRWRTSRVEPRLCSYQYNSEPASRRVGKLTGGKEVIGVESASSWRPGESSITNPFSRLYCAIPSPGSMAQSRSVAACCAMCHLIYSLRLGRTLFSCQVFPKVDLFSIVSKINQSFRSAVPSRKCLLGFPASASEPVSSWRAGELAMAKRESPAGSSWAGELDLATEIWGFTGRRRDYLSLLRI
jgi:hypothetical protein